MRFCILRLADMPSPYQILSDTDTFCRRKNNLIYIMHFTVVIFDVTSLYCAYV